MSAQTAIPPFRPFARSGVRNRGAGTRIRGVRAFSWNPYRPVIPSRAGSRFVLPIRVNNFGDLLGPLIVAEIVRRKGLTASAPTSPSDADAAAPVLFSVGSVVQFARPGDVVWGAGVNGKSLSALGTALSSLDVRAVRGPETRRELQQRGAAVPEVYGDPALLLPELWPALLDATDRKRRRVLVAPNLREYRAERAAGGARGERAVLNPQRPLGEVIRTIAESELVVGSSLHALIVAEALGVPAVGVVSAVEHPLKYADYYGGTGRPGVRLAGTVAEALSGRFAAPAPQWDPLPLLDAFPADLWRSAV